MDARLTSRERERSIVRWLDHIAPDADAIYLVGDVFDFWFEYKRVVPRGFVRLLGKLAELRDAGINIYYFTGNHDIWMFRYFEEELDIPTYRAPIRREIYGKQFLIGHGDGLGPGDHGYKFLKRVFSSPVNQWLYARLHPNFGIGLASYFSGRSRDAQYEPNYLGPQREWLAQYCETVLQSEEIDFFIFGHRHLLIDHTLSNGHSRYINLGEWLNASSYVSFDGQTLQHEFFEADPREIYGHR